MASDRGADKPLCRHENFDATVNVSRDVQGLSLMLTALLMIKCRDCGESLLVDQSRSPSFSEDGTIAVVPFVMGSKIKLVPWTKKKTEQETPTSSPPGHKRLSDG